MLDMSLEFLNEGKVNDIKKYLVSNPYKFVGKLIKDMLSFCPFGQPVRVKKSIPVKSSILVLFGRTQVNRYRKCTSTLILWSTHLREYLITPCGDYF